MLPAQFGVVYKHRTQPTQATARTNELPVEVILGKMEKVMAYSSAEEFK